MNWIATILLASAMIVWMVFYRIERKAHIRCHDEAVLLRRLLELEKEEREAEKWTEVRRDGVGSCEVQDSEGGILQRQEADSDEHRLRHRQAFPAEGVADRERQHEIHIHVQNQRVKQLKQADNVKRV